MEKTKLSSADLLELGFIEKPCIIHSSRVTREDEKYLGQIDENGNCKTLFVYRLPNGFRFDKFIVVNYRGEVYFYTSGFMSGGIEISDTPDDYRFNFRESDEWKAAVKNILSKLF